MVKLIKSLKRFIIITILFFMAVLITVTTFELIVFLVNEIIDLITQPGIFLGNEDLVAIFGFFFNVLIAFELFETIEMYLDDGTFHGEIILMIGIVAISRKIIVLDFGIQDPLLIIALGLLVGFLAAGYYFIKLTAYKKIVLTKNTFKVM